MTPSFQKNTKYPRPDLVTVEYGFAGGDPTKEYVEFRPYNSKIKFVAQMSPGIWLAYVYKIWPGKKGKVLTMNHFGDFGPGMPAGQSVPQVAADMAYNAARKMAEGN